MMKRFLRSRGVRKFRANRLAMFALGVVGVYFLMALFVVIGGVSNESVKERVLPDRWPGWLMGGGGPDEGKLVSSLEIRVDEIGRAFDRAATSEDPKRVISTLDWAERRIVDRPIGELTELNARMQGAWDTFRVTYGKWLELEDLLELIKEDIAKAETAGDTSKLEGFRAELDEVETELAGYAGPFREQLDAVQSAYEELYPEPTGVSGVIYGIRTLLGSDTQGRSICLKALYSTKIAFQIGFIVALWCVVTGTILGAAAAFYGGWVDYAVMWLVSTLSSIPYILLLAVVVFMFTGTAFDDATKPALALVPVYVAMGSTFWIGTCRVIRGEVLKIKELEYVQAATSIGFGRVYILLRHVIPNTTHLMFINFSLLFIGAIKSEVILSFLGLGVKGQPSWGVMISQGKDDVASFFFWEVLTATVFMFGLVYAFNILSDALQDAFDPKHVS